MEITPTFIIGIVVNLVIIGIAWGKIQAQLDETTKHSVACNERFKAVEENHASAIADIRDDMKAISGALNQLIGKIDMFFAQQHKNN